MLDKPLSSTSSLGETWVVGLDLKGGWREWATEWCVWWEGWGRRPLFTFSTSLLQSSPTWGIARFNCEAATQRGEVFGALGCSSITAITPTGEEEGEELESITVPSIPPPYIAPAREAVCRKKAPILICPLSRPAHASRPPKPPLGYNPTGIQLCVSRAEQMEECNIVFRWPRVGWWSISLWRLSLNPLHSNPIHNIALAVQWPSIRPQSLSYVWPRWVGRPKHHCNQLAEPPSSPTLIPPPPLRETF